MYGVLHMHVQMHVPMWMNGGRTGCFMWSSVTIAMTYHFQSLNLGFLFSQQSSCLHILRDGMRRHTYKFIFLNPFCTLSCFPSFNIFWTLGLSGWINCKYFVIYFYSFGCVLWCVKDFNLMMLHLLYFIFYYISFCH